MFHVILLCFSFFFWWGVEGVGVKLLITYFPGKSFEFSQDIGKPYVLNMMKYFYFHVFLHIGFT